MISNNQLQAVKDLLETLQALVPLLKDPKNLKGAIHGIEEAEKVIAQKNDVIDGLDEIRIWEEEHTKKQNTLERSTEKIKNDLKIVNDTRQVQKAYEKKLEKLAEELELGKSAIAHRQASLDSEEKAAEKALKKALDDQQKAEVALKEVEELKKELIRKVNLI